MFKPATRRRRRHARTQRAVVAGVALASLCAAALLVVAVWRGAGSTPLPAQNMATSADVGDVDLRLASASATSHPIYRHSVIPGGVRSGEELRDAVDRDPVVADHYRKVSLDRVRVERLPEPRQAYVSYRIGDRVYWTKDKVSLPAGETILTDGVTTIRARCGNCIASEPQLPTLAEEPEAVEFEALLPSEPVDKLAVATTPGRASFSGSDGQYPVDASLPSTGIGLPASRLATSGGGGPGVALPSPSPTSPSHSAGTKDEPDPAVSVSTPNDSSPPVDPPAGPTTRGPSPKTPVPTGPTTNTPKVTLPPVNLLPPVNIQTPGLTSDPFTPDVVQPVPVPEPSTLVLLGTGAAGALWRRVRARRR